MAIVVTVATVAAGACSDDDDGSGATSEVGAATTATNSATTEGGATTLPEPTTAQTATSSPTTAAPGTSGDDAASSTCPDAGAVSEALGRELAVDTESGVSMAGFCPYVSPDGNITMSLTYTPVDVTQTEEGERVDGVGERAFWSDGADELVVWDGAQGLIVSLLVFGPDATTLDTKAAAIALADVALS